MLEIGIKAPDFTLKDQNGQQHSLSDYLGKKVVLYFYPKDNTSGCTAQAINYSELADQFKEKDIIVLAVSKDSVASHKRFEEKQNLKLILLSDESCEVIMKYDAWKEKKLYGRPYMGTMRTTYLIDEKGNIIFANDKVKAAEDGVCMLNRI